MGHGHGRGETCELPPQALAMTSSNLKTYCVLKNHVNTLAGRRCNHSPTAQGKIIFMLTLQHPLEHKAWVQAQKSAAHASTGTYAQSQHVSNMSVKSLACVAPLCSRSFQHFARAVHDLHNLPLPCCNNSQTLLPPTDIPGMGLSCKELDPLLH